MENSENSFNDLMYRADALLQRPPLEYPDLPDLKIPDKTISNIQLILKYRNASWCITKIGHYFVMSHDALRNFEMCWAHIQ